MTATEVSGLTPGAHRERSFLGHPPGLAYIVFTEAWERFSFYGMQALLVLYMTGHLLHAGTVEGVAGFAAFRGVVEGVTGPLSVQALASQIFGLYVGLIYFTPVLGGLVGDRVTGRRAAVIIGAVLMAGGHFLMAFEASFLAALLLLILGSGFLKGNLAAQVGSLYAKTDQRRDAGFQLYCMAINVGAFVAPLVCGTLGELYGWHYGFAAAGVGMLVGIVVYLAGARHLPPEAPRATAEARPGLQAGDGRLIASLLALLGLTSLFWVAQTQVWNTYPMWLRDRVDRGVFDATIPVTWFQSLDSLAVLLLAPGVIWMWRRQSSRQVEPGEMTKIVLGCMAFAVACAGLALGEVTAAGKVALIWPVLFHFICAIAYLYAAPVALALVSRAAPPAVNAMMVGTYYLALFVGGLVSGWLGRFYEQMPAAGFWLMHGAIVGVGGLLILLLRPVFIRLLRLDAPTA
ncbi:peptide MFS transporter [Phenylobacterium sp.]|uniref:peptide MFS transporter n=1 Tax=Phenylobacterium sp. TaxID=1871053 RepID=UPI002FC7E7BF